MTPPAKDRMPPASWLAANLLTAAAVWLHVCFSYHAGGLWRDEVGIFNIATVPSMNQLWSALPHDHCPILFPLLLRLWAHAHFANLRLLGTLIGLLLLAAFWLAGAAMAKQPPLLSLGLAALNLTIIRYGDSLRAYGLGAAAIVLLTVLVWQFVEKPTLLRGLLAGVVAVLSVQTLYQNAFLLFGLCLAGSTVCLLTKRWRPVAGLIGIGSAAALSLLPYLRPIARAQQWWVVEKTGMHFSLLRGQIAAATGGLIGVWLILILLSLARAGYRALPRTPDLAAPRERNLAIFAAIALITGLAGFGAFIAMSGLPTEPWYYLSALAFAATCCDAIMCGGSRSLRIAILAAAILCAGYSFPGTCSGLSHRITNTDECARQLEADAQPGDFIIVTPWYCGIGFQHYYHGPTPWTTLPPLADYSWHRYDLVKTQLQNTNAIQPVLDRAAATLRAGHRVWVLADAGWMDIPDPGTESPYHLPAAPLRATGWLDLPYLFEWNSQAAHFLRNHTLQFERVAAPATGDLSGENLELFVVAGWKDSGRPVSPSNTKTTAP